VPIASLVFASCRLDQCDQASPACSKASLTTSGVGAFKYGSMAFLDYSKRGPAINLHDDAGICLAIDKQPLGEAATEIVGTHILKVIITSLRCVVLSDVRSPGVLPAAEPR
jgi:hypothetical protein